MKFLVAFVCALAVASAEYIAPVDHHYVHPEHHVFVKPEHHPVIGPNGVPVDTPAVQHAKAVHHAHKVEAHMRNGDYVTPYSSYPYAYHPYAYKYEHDETYPVATYPGHHHHHHHTETYPTGFVHPVTPVTAVHVPHEHHEEVIAKAKHYAAHFEALHRHRRDVYPYMTMPYTYGSHYYNSYPYSYNYGYPYHY